MNDSSVRKRERKLAWLAFGGLLALHLDFWRPNREVFEFWIPGLPQDFAYRLLWILLAWLWLLWFCLRLWPIED
ncbi:MAG: hypothetical protein DWQ01_05675 [Planctomycetota bacterium]|nr:MAG: hypothetical protein DWQ01_05675 [Planctomycetota bacterium]